MSNFRKHFEEAIRRHYPNDSVAIIRQVSAINAGIAKDISFAARSENPLDRRLAGSAYFLALIMTLHEAGEPFAQIRTLCLEIATNWVRPRNNVQAFGKRLAPKLLTTWLGQRLVRTLQVKVRRNKNPDGFIANIITDKQATYGFGYGIDILECGICKLFRKHRLDQYASILCEVDGITSNLAGLHLIRTGTIANGATTCDFRFQPA